jgi:hypothetical protein
LHKTDEHRYRFQERPLERSATSHSAARWRKTSAGEPVRHMARYLPTRRAIETDEADGADAPVPTFPP